MHPRETVLNALRLAEQGVPASEIVTRLSVPRGTVRDWVAGRVPKHCRDEEGCERCGGQPHEFEALPASYAYLLGLYLGDGCLSLHRRGVYKLRITLDLRYPGIIREAGEAMSEVMPSSKVGLAHQTGCVQVYSYAKAWPCLFPQHGPGKKHERPILLVPWQERFAKSYPQLLLRGLIHSDGCRFINTGRGGWSAPRYGFVNTSSDIRDIFCRACDELGLHWTTAAHRVGRTVYVSRVADVARLDEFVGPKA
jgi:hypothetical protein